MAGQNGEIPAFHAIRVAFAVERGYRLIMIAERFSVNEGAVDCGETEDIFPCKVVYINKTEQGEKN